LQIIVRVSCLRVEGWFLDRNEHVVSHLRLRDLKVLKLRCQEINDVISTKLCVFFYYLLNVLLMLRSK
jgi:hypothetical protein